MPSTRAVVVYISISHSMTLPPWSPVGPKIVGKPTRHCYQLIASPQTPNQHMRGANSSGEVPNHGATLQPRTKLYFLLFKSILKQVPSNDTHSFFVVKTSNSAAKEASSQGGAQHERRVRCAFTHARTPC